MCTGSGSARALADTEWLRDAGENGWVVLMKDDKIRYRPAELEALTASGVRAFCLTNANLRGAEMAQRLVEQLRKIEKIASDQPGPYIYRIYVDGVRPLWPK
jgi:hypothetical protein